MPQRKVETQRGRPAAGQRPRPADPESRRRAEGDDEHSTALVPGLLGIAGLSSLAFAQPLYDILRRSPEFFAIRDLYMGDLLALVAGLLVGPTLAFSAPGIVARFLRPSWTRWAIAPPIGLLAALIALQAANGLAAAGALGVALLVWLAASWAYVRLKGVRSFALLLSGAAVVVPALLILDGDVRRSATAPKPTVEIDAPDTGARAPIVLVIFDEWSLTSILDTEGAIDRMRFPNLAALADRATWYPNATAVADRTEIAVPAMLTGSVPSPGRLPTASEHPVNLFSLAAGSHDLHVVEPITSLCPPRLNQLDPRRPPMGERIRTLVSDLSLVWLRLTLPPPWSDRLPPVTQAWSGFGRGEQQEPLPPPADQPLERAAFHLGRTDRATAFRTFLERIEPARGRPGLYFIHSLLPHAPWEYLPSGKRYDGPWGDVHGLEREIWVESPWPALHHHKRYLLQVQFVDRLIGELTARLRSTGLFERSVIAITADHGVAFRPGRSRRFFVASDLESDQPLDLVSVPLVIKAPFQRTPRIDVDPVSLLGLTPLILELAGAAPGTLPLPDTKSGRPAVFGGAATKVPISSDRDGWRRARLTQQARLLGGTNDPMAIGLLPKLHGRPVTAFPVRTSESSIEIDDAWSWDHVDPNQPVVPALLKGAFQGPDPPAGRDVAVSLNGVIAASVKPHSGSDGRLRIAALLPEAGLRDGPNLIELFLVGTDDGDVELERLAVTETDGRRGHGPPVVRPAGKFELSWGDGGRPEALVRHPADAVDPTPERIEIVRRGASGLTGSLNGSPGGGPLIPGWATNLRDPGDRLEIVAFLGGRQIWTGTADVNRPDVAGHHGEAHLASGFVVATKLPSDGGVRFRRGHLSRLIRREGVVAYAVSRRGAATRLPFAYRPISRGWWGRETLPISDGRALPVEPVGSGFGGAIDVLTRRENRTVIEGWAADLERNEAARQIVIYRNDEFLATLPAGRERSDVAEQFENERLTRTGFSGRVPGAPDPAVFAAHHRVFAVMLRGVAIELAIGPHTAGAGTEPAKDWDALGPA